MSPQPPSPADPGALIPAAAVEVLAAAGWVTVFSGAGMSAESGVPTFREAQTGLWERFDPAELSTPEAWQRDPDLVWGWYRWRTHLVAAAQPNAGHCALAALARDRPVLTITQNVDDLHERAGSEVVAHLHGSLFSPRCEYCGAPYSGADADPVSATAEERVSPPMCPRCLSAVRPGVVWFGEALPGDAWSAAESAFAAADVVLVVGTSGIVYPAAALPERAADRGVPIIEINPEPSALTPRADWHIRATAAAALPLLVDAVRAAD